MERLEDLTPIPPRGIFEVLSVKWYVPAGARTAITAVQPQHLCFSSKESSFTKELELTCLTLKTGPHSPWPPAPAAAAAPPQATHPRPLPPSRLPLSRTAVTTAGYSLAAH